MLEVSIMLKKLFLVILVVLLSNCDQDPGSNEDDNNQNEGGGTATIAGNITLTNSSAWTNLKLGFFPVFTEVSESTYENYLKFDSVDDSYNNSYLYYSNNRDNSNVEIIPETLKDISSYTGTSSSYSFTLPEDPMVTGDSGTFFYRFAVWRDSDSDNKIDLYDQSWLSNSEENAGEYSRLPNKLLGDNEDDLAVIHAFQYVDSDTATGYKYSGLGDELMNYLFPLSDDSTGFDFTVEK